MKHLDDIEARLKAATPGPWANETAGIYGGRGLYDEIVDAEVSCGSHCYGGSVNLLMKSEDRELIAHAPDDLTRTTNALRAVLELHKRTKWEPGHPRPIGAREYGVCGWCGDPYPCLTTATITEALQGEQ